MYTYIYMYIYIYIYKHQKYKPIHETELNKITNTFLVPNCFSKRITLRVIDSFDAAEVQIINMEHAISREA